jgi:hypothetical protein
LRGTVENLAGPKPSACDAAARTRIKRCAGELYLREAFNPFGGAQRHADRMVILLAE